jgi:hypothetical protein
MNDLLLFLQQQHADQGGGATFLEWLEATAEDEQEWLHYESRIIRAWLNGEYAL